MRGSELRSIPWSGKRLKPRENEFLFLTALLIEAFAIRKALHPWLKHQNLLDSPYRQDIHYELDLFENHYNKLMRLSGDLLSKQVKALNNAAPIFVQALQNYSDGKQNNQTLQSIVSNS